MIDIKILGLTVIALTGLFVPTDAMLKRECYLPKEIGRCRAAIPRYYYNFKTNKCFKFFYGGCGANANNFCTLNDCKDRCVKKTLHKCKQPKKPGPCRGGFRRWYFDDKVQRCKKFNWGGCQANGNNFKSLHKCYKSCKSFY